MCFCFVCSQHSTAHSLCQHYLPVGGDRTMVHAASEVGFALTVLPWCVVGSRPLTHTCNRHRDGSPGWTADDAAIVSLVFSGRDQMSSLCHVEHWRCSRAPPSPQRVTSPSHQSRVADEGGPLTGGLAALAEVHS